MSGPNRFVSRRRASGAAAAALICFYDEGRFENDDWIRSILRCCAR